MAGIRADGRDHPRAAPHGRPAARRRAAARDRRRQDIIEARDGDPEALDAAARALDAAIAAIRQVTGSIRGEALGSVSLADGIERVVDEAQRRGPLQIQTAVDPEVAGLHDELLVHMVRELVVNVVKHAQAQTAQVTIARDGDGVRLTVEDDGRGMDPHALAEAAAAGHVGHARLQEQVDVLGGLLGVRFAPGHGTTITLRLPVPALEAQRRVAGLVRHERQWSAALLASVQDGLIVFRDHRVVQVNDRFCELTGFSRAELVAAPPGHPPFWPGATEPAAQAITDTMRVGSDGLDVEVELARRDGSRFPVLAAVRAIRDDAGRAVGVLVTVKDITAPALAEHRRGLEQQLAGARRSARALGGILERARAVRSPAELQTLLDTIARVVCQELGWAVVVNIVRPAWADVVVRAAYGIGEEATARLTGATYPVSSWASVLTERFERRGAYFIPAGAADAQVTDGPVYVPDIPASDDPDAWQPLDMLLVPVTAADGRRLGLLSLDLPGHGRRPDDDELDVLVAVGAQIGVALEQVQLSEAVQRRERVQKTLSHLIAGVAGADPATILPEVLAGLARTLAYRRVVLDLVDPGTGRLQVHTAIGVPEEKAALLLAPADPILLDAATDQRTLLLGHRLLDAEEAAALVGPERAALAASRTNGVGEQAWRDHLLVLPVRSRGSRRDGRVVGCIWVQDPSDRLLPNAGRLRALRSFAGLAGLAVAGA